jgi:hypothetical protein
MLHSFHALSFTGKHDLPFKPEEYSWFKHGCKTYARKFGEATADAFFKHLLTSGELEAAKAYPITVAASPYINVPTATYAMKDYFIERFNHLLNEQGYGPVQETRVYRFKSYADNYGLMTAEERLKALEGDAFYTDINFLTGKLAIFLDDIYITGGHESRVAEMLAPFHDAWPSLGPFRSYAVVYAKLVNNEADPTIEDWLNHYSVKTLYDVARIINDGHFQLNTRVLKFILRQPGEQLEPFLQYMNKGLLQTMRSAAIGNDYDNMHAFKGGFALLTEVIKNYKVRPVNQNYPIEL